MDETETLAKVETMCSLVLSIRYLSGTTTYDERSTSLAVFSRLSVSSSDRGYLKSYESPSLIPF